MIELDVQGLNELAQALENLGDKLSDKVLTKALNAGARPIKKDAKARASIAEKSHIMTVKGGRKVEVRPTLLRQAIRQRKIKKSEMKKAGLTGTAVSIYIGKGTKQKEYPRYWHFIEYGTPHHPAVPFLRPAFVNNTQKATDIFAQKLAKEIDKVTQG